MRDSLCLLKVLYGSEGQSLLQFVVLYDPSFFSFALFFWLENLSETLKVPIPLTKYSIRFNHPMPTGYKEKLAGLERELRER